MRGAVTVEMTRRCIDRGEHTRAAPLRRMCVCAAVMCRPVQLCFWSCNSPVRAREGQREACREGEKKSQKREK